jgi:rubrerythrin
MAEKTMTDMDKLAHLLEHWREHNDEHAANYNSWADKADREGKQKAAALLRQAAEATTRISDLFAKATEELK